MAQGVLSFQYQEEASESGMTAWAGLPLFLDLAQVAGLWDSITRHVSVRARRRGGWSDAQTVMSLVLLNLVGGSGVSDIRILEGDRGLGEVLHLAEAAGLTRQERRASKKKRRTQDKRGTRVRNFPSESAIFRYLAGFHDPQQEVLRATSEKAFIPSANQHLRGLGQVNTDFLAFVQTHKPRQHATIDMDATLVSTEKREAFFCYKKFKAFQPLNAYWAEQELIVRSEFRDGNVPAGYQQLRVFKESLDALPEGVERVFHRSDSAGYQIDLLKYCAEGSNERFGVIDFAIASDVTDSFKQAVAEVPDADWQPLHRTYDDGMTLQLDQEWAEVCYVPNWAGHSKKGPTYRFLAIREPLRQLEIPGTEPQPELPFQTIEYTQHERYKLFGLVTNRDIPGDELIAWHRQRCGKSEAAHAVMKNDLAGGQLPSNDFGENAAWWAIMILAFNLSSAMKHLVLGPSWARKRMKAIRFAIVNLPARVVRHARQLFVRLTKNHPSNATLIAARKRILRLACGPSG
jgi:hypothetical protein